MKKAGVQVFIVDSPQSGTSLAKEIIYKNSDNKTILFLSGGSTPKILYEKLALEGKLDVGAAAMVDERPGAKAHPDSNEKMISGTGLLSYFRGKGISFFPIIEEGKTKQETAIDYDKTVKSLFANFAKKFAILGVGEDGHTAGIPVGIKSAELTVNGYVAGYNTFPNEPKERISLTFEALSQLDQLIILAFGDSKREPLRKMFEKGPIEEIPSRFYVKPDISEKVILITDQKL